jgi:hypothetical protein
MLLITIYALGLGGLLLAAVAIFRTYCEGFGCMGIGVMWLAWSAIFGAWLAYGSIAYARVKAVPGRRRLMNRLLGGQYIAGALLLGYWAYRRFG